MLKPNRVKQQLARGETVIGSMFSEARSPGFMWAFANLGYDFVFIDMEHGGYDLTTVSDLIKVARLANLTPLVRIPDLAYHLVATVLDAGAMGLMLPRVETREQVETFISYMKYPPVGVRGGSAGRGHTDYAGATPRELTTHMNEHTLAVIQIERKVAVERIDDLMSVPGVDVALIGPFDMAISLDAASGTAPEVNAAIQQVVDAGARHGVVVGTHSPDANVVLEWHRRGMRMLMCNSDLGFFMAAAQQTLHTLRTGTGAGTQSAGPELVV